MAAIAAVAAVEPIADPQSRSAKPATPEPPDTSPRAGSSCERAGRRRWESQLMPRQANHRWSFGDSPRGCCVPPCGDCPRSRFFRQGSILKVAAMAAIVEVEPITRSSIPNRETGNSEAAGHQSVNRKSVRTRGPEAVGEPAHASPGQSPLVFRGQSPRLICAALRGLSPQPVFSSGIDSEGCSDGGDCRG
jgi:hypothetical protein